MVVSVLLRDYIILLSLCYLAGGLIGIALAAPQKINRIIQRIRDLIKKPDKEPIQGRHRRTL